MTRAFHPGPTSTVRAAAETGLAIPVGWRCPEVTRTTWTGTVTVSAVSRRRLIAVVEGQDV